MIKESVKIGKKILQVITTGMYTDSRFIYREYIQNAADAIDEAIEKNILEPENALINIELDDKYRQIIIEDNATGIPANKVIEMLGNIADSNKDQDIHKGFIGIGRLGGLAYCKELIFETSYYGEETKTMMCWDACKLQELIENNAEDLDVVEVIKKITTFKEYPADKNEHFFRVVMNDVNQSNELLLDIDEVREYMSMVAPVPFKKDKFFACHQIYTEVQSKNYPINEYNIHINTEPLFKIYTPALYESTKKEAYDYINEVAFNEYYNSNNELLAWSWIGINRFDKCIPEKNNPQRGMRLRKHNIQFGDSETLNKLMKEARSNGYFVGEVHVVHKNLIPNGRRDYFRENNDLLELEHQLKEYFLYFYKNYHLANDSKNAYKNINEYIAKKQEFEEKDRAGLFVSETEIEIKKKDLEDLKGKAEKAKNDLEKIKQKSHEDEVIKKIYESVTKTYKKSHDVSTLQTDDTKSDNKKTKKYRSSSLNKLTRNERKLVSEIFELIQSVLDPDTAENIIRKIEEMYT